MRGVKGSNYDGGHRVPCFIRWPKGGIQGGKDINQLTAQFDLMPTLIDLCQLKNMHTIDFDGRSLVPLLKDNKSKWEERTLFVHYQGVENPKIGPGRTPASPQSGLCAFSASFFDLG